MAEPQIVTTLSNKRDELERTIISYETAITAAKRDLAHVNATLELLERNSGQTAYPSRLSIVRMFKRGELFALCNAALAEAPKGLDTRELALAMIRAKGMDEADTVLRKAIGFRIVQVMLRQEARGYAAAMGKRRGAIVWSSLITTREA
jgi:poly-gamma-glutamate capsule biosynthesis protein CapA/YwtB (metallophosphatase superfamily)